MVTCGHCEASTVQLSYEGDDLHEVPASAALHFWGARFFVFSSHPPRTCRGSGDGLGVPSMVVVGLVEAMEAMHLQLARRRLPDSGTRVYTSWDVVQRLLLYQVHQNMTKHAL